MTCSMTHENVYTVGQSVYTVAQNVWTAGQKHSGSKGEKGFKIKS